MSNNPLQELLKVRKVVQDLELAESHAVQLRARNKAAAATMLQSLKQQLDHSMVLSVTYVKRSDLSD